MQIIPVIDLMGGVVVHARRGERANYRPIESKLCPSAEPGAMVAALLGLYPFSTLYVADLDAIRGSGDHLGLLQQLKTRFPSTEFWLDAGITTFAQFQQLSDAKLATLIIGSESLRDDLLMRELRTRPHAILSLDFKDGAFLGPQELIDDRTLWPEKVLAMNLSRVGAGLGPDLALIQSLMTVRPDCLVYAAGGVRNRSDIETLQAIGAAGALVATALHSGELTGHDLLELSKPTQQ